MTEEEHKDTENFEKTLLIDAVSRENLEDVKWLIQYVGSSVNEPSNDGTTPLGTAILRENLDIVRLLIERGADPNTTYPFENEDGTVVLMSPLIEALELENSDIASFLIVQASANLNLKNDEGASPLHVAVSNSLEDIVHKLLQCNVSINEKDNNGATPLMIAAEEGDNDILKTLITNDAQIDDQDLTGSTALMLAVKQYLLEDESEETRDCVDTLIKANAALNVTDEDNNNVLMRYDEEWNEDNEELMFSLIRAGCSINQQNNKGETPLRQQVENTNITAIQQLIAHGADVNFCVDNFCTLLDLTAGDWESEKDKCFKVTELLLKAGADPNIGRPAVVAAYEKRKRMVNLLLKHGADINRVHPFFGTVLLMGGYKESYNTVKVALKYKAQINISQIPQDDLPDPPYEANSRAVMLMFVPGEHFPFHLYPDEDIATPIVESRDDLSLKNLCRKAIRNHTIMSENHENLFEATQKLHLPSLMESYILYGMSLSDEEDDDEDGDEDDDEDADEDDD